MTPQEEIAEQMQESTTLFQKMESQRVPYRDEIRAVQTQLKGMNE